MVAGPASRCDVIFRSRGKVEREGEWYCAVGGRGPGKLVVEMFHALFGLESFASGYLTVLVKVGTLLSMRSIL